MKQKDNKYINTHLELNMISRHFKWGEFFNLFIQLNGKEKFCGSVVEGSSRQVMFSSESL